MAINEDELAQPDPLETGEGESRFGIGALPGSDTVVARDTRDLVLTVIDGIQAVVNQDPSRVGGRQIVTADELLPDRELPEVEGAEAVGGPGEGEVTSTGKGTAQTGPMAWGEFQNGRIPADALAPIEDGTHRLEPTAAQAWERMKADAAQDGVTLDLTDSYRSFDAQVAAKANKPTLAATPGSSNHGWGKAVDVASQEARRWVQENGARYGWVWPEWAQPGGSKPEDWHFEFRGESKPKPKGPVRRALESLRTREV